MNHSERPLNDKKEENKKETASFDLAETLPEVNIEAEQRDFGQKVETLKQTTDELESELKNTDPSLIQRVWEKLQVEDYLRGDENLMSLTMGLSGGAIASLTEFASKYASQAETPEKLLVVLGVGIGAAIFS